jgi:hypothetical protein
MEAVIGVEARGARGVENRKVCRRSTDELAIGHAKARDSRTRLPAECVAPSRDGEVPDGEGGVALFRGSPLDAFRIEDVDEMNGNGVAYGGTAASRQEQN